MSVTAAVGELVRLHFPIFEEDGFTPYDGLTNTDFAKELIRDSAVVVSVTPTVSEVGASGVYVFEFTPDQQGTWYVEAASIETEEVWACRVKVGPAGAALGYVVNETQLNVAYDESISKLFMEVWLDRNGVSVASGLVNCSVSVFDDSAALLFTVTSSSPDVNGRFSLQQSSVTLQPHRPYNATVMVQDGAGSVTTFHAFTTVG